MKEYVQAGNFYRSLREAEKNDLADSIAADIFFLDEKLQERICDMLLLVDEDLKERVVRINAFTL